jgi:hypothetical protein
MATTKIAVTAATNISLGGGDTAETLATQLAQVLGALPAIFTGPASVTTGTASIQAALDVIASALANYGNATVSKTTA